MTGKIKFTIGGESHEVKIDSWQRSNVSPSIELTVERTMTTEDKARDMVRKEDRHSFLNYDAALAALCRAIEQHEATKQELADYKQEVSDTIQAMLAKDGAIIRNYLDQFIIPAPKPDPLVRVINEVIYAQPHGDIDEVRMAGDFRAALDSLGLEIREKNDD